MHQEGAWLHVVGVTRPVDLNGDLHRFPFLGVELVAALTRAVKKLSAPQTHADTSPQPTGRGKWSAKTGPNHTDVATFRPSGPSLLIMDINETSNANDDDDKGIGAEKLIPEWSVGADDQIVLAGLLVVLALFLGTGWNLFFGGDGEEITAGATSTVVPDPEAPVEVSTTAGATATTAADTTTSSTVTSTTSTESAQPEIGDVQAAVTPLPGEITGTAQATTAVLTGYVANQAESDEAETAAARVAGITAVDNQLELLEPGVLDALGSAGVVGPAVSGVGTAMTVSGTLPSEADRQPTLDAAAAVPGVTAVNDELTVSVTDQLNQLPQVQFATGSAEILEASYADLDRAAQLLIDAGDDIAVEIQGYTDIRGDEALNLELSNRRTESVRTYLIDAGVNPDVLSAVGYGETEQFAEGVSIEALAANRVVRFEQTS